MTQKEPIIDNLKLLFFLNFLKREIKNVNIKLFR